MDVLNGIRFLAGAVCILAGLIFYVIQMIGVYRFKSMMNRMHAVAIGDTLGSGLILLGVIIYYGFNLATLKIIFLILFLWLTAPVAAHMIAKLEVTTGDRLTGKCIEEDRSKKEEK